MKKNGLIAFLLAFIPGVGHAYLNRKARAVLYGIGFFGVLGAGLLLAVATNMANSSSWGFSPLSSCMPSTCWT